MSSEANDHVCLSSLTLFSEKVHASEVFVDGWMSLNHAVVLVLMKELRNNFRMNFTSLGVF